MNLKQSILFLGSLLALLYSCSTEQKFDREIKTKLLEFYTGSEVEDYLPIAYSELDTIQDLKAVDGSILRITAVMTHEFMAKARNGSIRNYVDTIDIVIFKDDVVVLPRGY